MDALSCTLPTGKMITTNHRRGCGMKNGLYSPGDLPVESANELHVRKACLCQSIINTGSNILDKKCCYLPQLSVNIIYN